MKQKSKSTSGPVAVWVTFPWGLLSLLALHYPLAVDMAPPHCDGYHNISVLVLLAGCRLSEMFFIHVK